MRTLGITAGRRHAWVEGRNGLVRKPLGKDFVFSFTPPAMPSPDAKPVELALSYVPLSRWGKFWLWVRSLFTRSAI